MDQRLTGSILLAGLAIAEIYLPGWMGAFSQAMDVTDEARRISMSIFVTGSVVLFFSRFK